MGDLSAVRHDLLRNNIVVVGEKYNTNHRIKDCEQTTIHLKSINGQVIMQINIDSNIQHGSIDISTLADGMYIFEILCNNSIETHKFIVNKK